MEEFTPELFGKYVLVDRIATGGMAEIFLARNYAVGGFESTFVLKRILPHLGADTAFVELFVTEAKVSVGLQHPNVVRVFDFGQQDGHYFLVMEHIDGRDARRVLRAASRAGVAWPLELALYVVSEACKGLHYAHTRTSSDGAPLGIVHRDISPSNLLLSWDGDVKVADFGIARADWAADEEEGGVKGKYEYMSPEQASGGAVDARSDVFSAGVVLYEMVTGRRAFRGADEAETLARLKALDRAPVGEVAPAVPEAVVAVIDRALAGPPDERFASARELGEAVRRALGGASDDALREQLSVYIRGLFVDEIVAERERLALAGEIAQQLRAAAEVVADEAQAAPRRGRLMGGLAVAALGVVLLGAGALWMSGQDVRVPAVMVEATGSIVLDLTPKARVYVSGRLEGEGEQLALPNLAPGDYELRIEADGFRTAIEQVRVTRGGATRVRRQLEALAADPPVVVFESRPAGALVLVDGRAIGVTPLNWAEGEPGKAYDVELRLDGYDPVRGRTGALQAGERSRFNRALGKDAPEEPEKPEVKDPPPEKPPPEKPPEKPPANEAGSLKVVLIGANWATVYIDGRKVDRPAPFAGVALPAGEHTIKVENPGLGLSHTERVNVAPGGSVTVRVVGQ